MSPKPRSATTAASHPSSWEDLLRHIPDAAALEDFDTLRSALVAAREAGDAEMLRLIESVASFGARTKSQRYALAREFVAAERPAAAWAALTSSDDYLDDPGFAKQARRIYARLPRSPLRRQIARVIAGIEKRELKMVRVASEVRFADGTVPSALTIPRICASSRTPAHHVTGVAKYVQQVQKRHKGEFPPAVSELANVFVDGVGQIWGEEGQIYKDTGKPKPPLKRTDVEAIAVGIHSIKSTRGIYHWLVDRVPNLSCLSDPSADAAVVLIEGSASQFVTDTLVMAGIKQDRARRVTSPVFVERLLLPRVGFAGLRYWHAVSPIINAVQAESHKLALEHGFSSHDRIYISRRDSSRRPMENEAELERLMTSRGYFVVSFGEIPLWQQIYLASTASEIVSPHGAGLSHILFMRQDAKVTEILPIKYGTYVLRLNYALLSGVRGIDYRAWMEPQNSTGEGWVTDLDEFTAFLDRQQ